ncbi:hypothetical protein BMS3Bbin03_02042 [bacterium BMS3Bbin03]|nr:hypothetical protein BMS3Bbin03_02042 [bacterium BMS3Bbin03]
MLSIIDLIEAGTLDLDKSGWLISRIESGSSFLVGAKPGGAGKTTVMGALLVMLPPGAQLYLAGDRTTSRSRLETTDEQQDSAAAGRSSNSACNKYMVSYEISPAFYEGYVWGKAVREMFAMTDLGFKIAANLHADTLGEAKHQIVMENGVPEHQFNTCGIFVPITLRGWKREVNRIFYYDNPEEEGWRELSRYRKPLEREIEIQDFLKSCVRNNIRQIEEVRTEWLALRSRHIKMY